MSYPVERRNDSNIYWNCSKEAKAEKIFLYSKIFFCASSLIIYLTCVADQSFHIETFQLFIFQLDEDDLSFETQNFNEKLCKLKTFLLDIYIHIMVRSLMVDIYKTLACALSAQVSTLGCFPVISSYIFFVEESASTIWAKARFSRQASIWVERSSQSENE